MKVVLFLFALIGAACALQYPLEYQYDYEGRLGMAIPKISARVSAMGIKARLILQMKQHGVGIAQLKDVEAGTFLGDFHSNHLRARVPIKFSPLTQYANLFEEPFNVNFLHDNGQVMIVNRGEPGWMTNVRKGIVEAFLLDPLRSNHLGSLQVQGHKSGKVYSVEEESIFGRCRSIYSMTPYPSHMIPSIIQHMEKDIQSSQSKTPSTSSVPSISEKYWKMVRTIDFDSCTDRVVLQHAGHGNYSGTGFGMFRSLSARSSIGSYILKGEPGSFRVEKAMIEGSVVRDSFGFESEKMESLTNQTMILRSAGPVSSPLRVPTSTKNVKTWRYEVTSPFTPPSGPQRPWVNYTNTNDQWAPIHPLYYLLGTTPNPKQYEDAKNVMLKLIETAANELSSFLPNVQPAPPTPAFNSRPGIKIVRELRQAQMIMLGMPTKYIEEVFSAIFQSSSSASSQRIQEIKQSLLIDVVAASGSAPALKVLFQKAPGHMTPHRLSTVFMTLTNSLSSPIILEEMMKVVESKVDVTKYPGPQILINFANLLNRYCLNRKGLNYTLPNPIYGSHVCKPSLVSTRFVPYLKNQLKSSSSPIYAKTGIMYAMSTLGSPQLMDILRRVALGVGPAELRNPHTRTAAIAGLSKGRLPSSIRHEVMEILLQLVDDMSQPTELRQVALLALVSWHPSPAVWNKLARQTWREPSTELAAFIYFTIDNMAISNDPMHERQMIIAKYARGLARPFSHAIRYSYNLDRASFLQYDKMGLSFDFARVFNPRLFSHYKTLIPRELFSILEENYGGITEDLAEFSMSTEGFGPLMAKLLKSIPMNAHSSAGRNAQGQQQEPSVRILAKMFDNMIHYLPLEAKDLIGPDAQRVMNRMVKGSTMNITKYMSPLTENFFIPTELGIPLIGMSSIPMVLQSDMEVQLKINTTASNPTIADMIKADSFSLVSKSYTKATSKLFMSLRAIIPWSHKQVTVEVDNVRSINLPVYTNLTVINKHHLKNITLNIAPLEGVQKMIPIYAENMPFVAIKPSMLKDSSNVEFEPLTIDPDHKPLQEVHMPSNVQSTGIKGDLVFQGDVTSPYSRGFFFYYLRQPPKFLKLFSSPTAKFWRTYLLLHPESSATKNISVSLCLTKFGKMFDSSSSSSSSPTNKLPQFSPMDSGMERLHKIHEMTHGQDPTLAFNAQLSFNGSEFRRYEFLSVISRQTPLVQEYKKFYWIMALMANPMTSKDGQSRVLSVENKIETPSFIDAAQMIEMIESGKMKQKIKGQITYGPTTSSNNIGSFEIDVAMHQERQRMLKGEVERLCAFDPMNPINHLRVPAVYDEARLGLKYQNVPPQVMNTTMNVTDFVKGMFYPFTYVDRYDINNPQGEMKMRINRPIWSNFYTMKMKTPREEVIIDHIYVPEILSTIMPFRKLKVHCNVQKNDLQLNSMESSKRCRITEREIKTFDDVTYPFRPLKCASVAATSRLDINNSYKVYVLQKDSKNIGAVIELIRNKYIVKITHSEVMINGQPMSGSMKEIKDHQGKVIMVIEKKDQKPMGYVVKVPGQVSVFIMQSEIRIVPLVEMSKSARANQGPYRGLCGDYDGSKMYDLTGPKDCLYTNGTLFGISWSEKSGPHCDQAIFDKEYRKVIEFQQRCKTRSNAKLSLAEQPSEPYSFVYPIVKKDSYLCISESPVKRCHQGHKMSNKEHVEIPSKCWSQSQAPSEVVSGYQKGYLPHPINQHQEMMKEIQYSKAVSCH